MNRYPMIFAPQHWSPKLSPWVIRLMRPWRLRRFNKQLQLNEVQVAGAANLKALMESNVRVMITPNHPSHADPFVVFEACEQAGTPCHIMAAWHVFMKHNYWQRWLLQWHGCFSIDREANDLTAFREAIAILKSKPQPLLIFPEGDIFHCNDLVTPFREGAAAIALAAAKRSEQSIAILPTSIRYRYAEDPMPQLLKVIDNIERRILWRPRPDVPIVERIWSIGNAVLGLKEQEFYGQAKKGSLPERLHELADAILAKLEERYGLPLADSVPKRVKQLRQCILTKVHDHSTQADVKAQLRDDLDDAFEALQLFSYPGNYLEGEPTLERIAETVDKLEEDVLQSSSAGIRGRRNAKVEFGRPIYVSTEKRRGAAAQLTHRVQSEVERLVSGNRADDSCRGYTDRAGDTGNRQEPGIAVFSD